MDACDCGLGVAMFSKASRGDVEGEWIGNDDDEGCGGGD
jgi:hypothetical protein